MGIFIDEPYSWARTSPNGYEVSSAGDERFSAFNAKINYLSDSFPNRNEWTIELIYQVIIKGYRLEASRSGLPFHMWWKVGKGKKPKRNIDQATLYKKYLALWRIWCDNNPTEFHELSQLARGKVLTDRFATTEINQARALSDLLNEHYGDV